MPVPVSDYSTLFPKLYTTEPYHSMVSRNLRDFLITFKKIIKTTIKINICVKLTNTNLVHLSGYRTFKN